MCTVMLRNDVTVLFSINLKLTKHQYILASSNVIDSYLSHSTMNWDSTKVYIKRSLFHAIYSEMFLYSSPRHY